MAHIINNFMSILTIAVVFSVALAAPNKDTSEPSDETAQSESSITNNNDFVSESASIGGFNAASSLADNGSAMASTGGNDLGASGPGGTVAGAEFINVSELASNEMLMKPATEMLVKPATEMLVKPATEMLVKPAIVVFYLFDKIFNIPINVLQYINTYLNQKQMHRGQSEAAVSSNESAGASGNGTAGASMMVPTKSNYDAIFNIPITALRFVQNLYKWVAGKLLKNHGTYNSGAH